MPFEDDLMTTTSTPSRNVEGPASNAAEPAPTGAAMRLSIVAAVASNRAIGRDNALLWRLPGDMRHFRETTTGAPVIMGRKTWDSIGRPLPGRRNIVVTRQAGWSAVGAFTAGSLSEAIALASRPGDDVAVSGKAYVIGGAELYAQALPLADEMIITEVDGDFEGDTFFPLWEPQSFDGAARGERLEENGLGYRFVTYRRRR
nr:Dihydrofolate reductase [uncultured bacterium]